MRIIELEFENINSYEGKVRIDFTDEAFRKNNNQFVISGETAAGKSTILDAISLALYGATERVGRIVKGDGTPPELMNKNTGYCSASIIYTCPKGKYKNTFYMQKARLKKNGNVQHPVCSVEDLDTGEFLLSNEKTTEKLAEQTEKLIGLSSDQFIRCILIPQGEFDRFISSNERAKAGILAKLSRTEEYKKVGAYLCEKASSLNRQYDNEIDKIGMIEILSDEERDEKEKEKEGLGKEIADLNDKITVLDKKISLKQKLSDAEKEYKNAEEGLKSIREKEAEYKENKDVLNKAKKANRCIGEYDKLNGLNNEINTEQEKLSEIDKKLKEIQAAAVSAKENSFKCNDDYDKLCKEKSSNEPVWDEVDELDKNLSSLKIEYNTKKKDLEKAEKALSDGKTELDNLKTKEGSLKAEISELSSYLEDNKKDENIGVIIAEINVNNNSLVSTEDAVKKSKDKKQIYEKKLADETKNYEMLISEKKKLEEELAAFVNSKHILIANILKDSLKPGNPCPVCGAEYHPGKGCDVSDSYMIINEQSEDIYNTDEKINANSEDVSSDITEERSKVTADISKMSDELKEKDEAIKKSEIAIEQYKKDIQTEAEKIDNGLRSIKSLIDNINTATIAWGLDISNNKKDISDNDEINNNEISVFDLSISNKIKIITDKLSEISKVYSAKKQAYSDKNLEYNRILDRMSNIDIIKLEEDKNSAEADFKDIEKNYNELNKKRESLFGSKNVKEVRADYNKRIDALNKKKQEAEQEVNRINYLEVDAKSSKKASDDRINELSVKIEETDKRFKKLLIENQFETEAAFLLCKRSDKEIANLESSVVNYETDTRLAEDKFSTADKKLKEIQKEEISDESLEKLIEENDIIKEQKDICNRKLGAIALLLKNDAENVKKKADSLKNIEELAKTKQIYNDIKEMIGKASGEDFEVFVQSIAMKSLIAKANEYLSNIFPQYFLIQKDNTVDFIVRETYMSGTSSDRTIENFSGGEKFIISLCFALAIAECAGQKGSVESIFLDEGFGNLSGQTMRDAIDALKKLSTTGKMLGIITHVEPVIQEFMQIEAVKIGDRSILKGPGIYC